MSPSRKVVTRRSRGQDVRHRAHAYARHITALEAAGWRLVGLRPDVTGAALWRARSERYDESASISVTEADPDAALAELVRYAQVDAVGAR
jgi:hypothetical protein